MKTYRVKPLEWKGVWLRPELPQEQHAETMFGLIACYDRSDGKSRLICNVDGRDFNTFAEAKAAAESWYLERLLPAMEEVTT